MSGSRAGGLAEPRHLGEPARDQRRLRVVAEPEPVDAAGGERDHVLRRRAQLDADEVVVDVDAEGRRVDRVLELERERVVLARRSRPPSAAPRATSSAMFGPERTATGRPRTSVDSRSPVAGSSPFVRLSIGASPGIGDDVAEGAARHGDDDERPRRRTAPRRSSRRATPRGRPSSGSAGSARSRAIARACSASRQASETSCPRSRSSHANAVPHEPAPTTTAFTRRTKSIDDRDALEPEPLAQLVLDPVAVVARDEARVVDEEAEPRRARLHLRPVEEVEAAARSATAAGAPRAARRGSGSARASRRAPCASRTASRPCRAGARSRGRSCAETAITGGRWRRRRSSCGLHVLEPMLDHVPLREDDERRALRLPRHVGDGQVPLDDPLARRRRARARRRPARPPRARAAPSSTRSPAGACACGAGPAVSTSTNVASVALEHRVDRVARRARDLRDDHALLAEQRVQQRRLADVRAAEDGDADRVLADLGPRSAPSSRAARRPRRAGRRCRARAAPRAGPGRRGRAGGTRAHRVLARRVVELVREQQHRLVRAAQDRRRSPRRRA